MSHLSMADRIIRRLSPQHVTMLEQMTVGGHPNAEEMQKAMNMLAEAWCHHRHREHEMIAIELNRSGIMESSDGWRVKEGS